MYTTIPLAAADDGIDANLSLPVVSTNGTPAVTGVVRWDVTTKKAPNTNEANRNDTIEQFFLSLCVCVCVCVCV